MSTLTPSFLCARCLHRPTHLLSTSTRLLSTTTFPSLPPPPPLHGYARLTSRRLIDLHGRDAPHFLQGLTTQNIPSQPLDSALYSCFLNAAGRVLYDVFIYPSSRPGECNEGFLIDVDAKQAERLARHLKRFRLRADVKIQVVEEGEMGVWGVWGEDDGGPGYEDLRAPGMGRRVLVSGDANARFPGQEATVGSYNVRRMMKGVAEGQDEILSESALPQESNIDFMGGIDFRKGCYVGQELTIRTHHTGVVRKRILPVQIYDGSEDAKAPESLIYDPNSNLVLPPQGTNIAKLDAKGRSAGKWVGGVGNIGFALCRLETMTGMSVTGEMGSWSPEQEFKMSWNVEEGREGSEVKVKAFVPSWHMNRPSLRHARQEKEGIIL